MFGWWRPFSQQLHAVLEWLSGVANERDIIFVDLPGTHGCFYFDFPLRFGDRPKKMRMPSSDRTPMFIICNAKPNEKLDAPWIKIFSSPEIEILERTDRLVQVRPLRWGFDEEERIIALKIARHALEKFFVTGERFTREYFSTLSERFQLSITLDVALWTKGHLRGSSIVERRHLGEGIADAAVNASRDPRFKPLSPEELADTQIEITIMHDLRLPLLPVEFGRNAIYSEKGYLLQQKTTRGHSNILKNVGMKSGVEKNGEGRKGWFLPEAHNARRFQNLEDFLGDLAESKAGLSRAAYKDADISIFEVDDFIESEDGKKHLSLFGPVVAPESVILNSEFIIQRLRMAADWLCRIQEPDGNLPPIIDPLTGRQTQIDWPRLAFTALALAEFGKAAGEQRYSIAAEKSFEYLKSYLITNSQFQISNSELTLAYFGQLSLALGKPNEAGAAADRILSRLAALNFEPLTFAQIASFFKMIRADHRFSTPFENLTRILKEKFAASLESGRAENLAVWAELAHSFHGSHEIFYQRVNDWLKGHQLSDGAFPESTIGGVPYTRGTGKVFEVLALDPGKNKDAIDMCLAWLLSMQYDQENTFFIREEIRPKVIGGFRHDYLTVEAWIDAAGHVLLGVSRLRIHSNSY